MKKSNFIFIFFIGILILTNIFLISTRILPENKNINDRYFDVQKQTYKIFQPYIPDSIKIFDEKVPIEHIMVRENLERELMAVMYWHSRTMLIIKRTFRFFPIIEPILKENGIPDDFKYLAVTESELSTPVSPAGATGYWQFMKETAKQYGLEVNSYLDERNHIIFSTRAACQYIKDLKKQYGSYTLAASVYNAGPKKIQEYINTQQTNNYYFLSMNEETSRYIYRIIAYKLICENPTRYGFFLRQKDVYQPWQGTWIEIDSAITDLVKWGHRYHLTYAELKYFNPWIKGFSLPAPTNKKYSFFIPSKLNFDSYISDLKEPEKIVGDTIKF
ncbi:MAG: transglycosylase SLT domain-containing protein [Bacteroidales bacterium]|nr:transglycosylase SLT domain-containing protein [Bacteroidales bacterium]